MKDDELDCELVLACFIHEMKEVIPQMEEEAKKAPKVKMGGGSQRDWKAMEEAMKIALTRLINLIRNKEFRDRVAQSVKPQDHPYWVEKGNDYD